jgi:hypothetical protein
MLISAGIGLFTRGRGWLTPAAIGPSEFAAALYRGGSMAAHWTGPLVYFVALSVPMITASFLGRRIRARALR